MFLQDRPKKKSWFAQKDTSKSRRQSDDSGHTNLRPLRSGTSDSSPNEKDAVVIKNPTEDFMQFAFISITACLLSPTYFQEETDPKGIWRRSVVKNMMDVLKFHHGKKTMEAIMSGKNIHCVIAYMLFTFKLRKVLFRLYTWNLVYGAIFCCVGRRGGYGAAHAVHRTPTGGGRWRPRLQRRAVDPVLPSVMSSAFNCTEQCHVDI